MWTSSCSLGLQLLRVCGAHVLLYHSRLWWSGVYPPQQSASWYYRNRLLDFRHVVCVVVLRPVILLLETTIFKHIVKRARRQLRLIYLNVFGQNE